MPDMTVVDQQEHALLISPYEVAPCKKCGYLVVYRPTREPKCVPCDWAEGRDAAEKEAAANA